VLAGHTRPFYNLYEFNTGNDAERRAVSNYNLPFSLVFSLGYWVDGRALGWNLTGFVALWLTHLFTWLLLRRYIKDEAAAALLALLAISVPYRWPCCWAAAPPATR